MRWCIWLTALTAIDGLQTIVVVATHGLRMEANPVMRTLMAEYSHAGLWGIKLLALLVILAFRHHLTLRVVKAATLGMALIVLSNALTITSFD